MQSEVQNGSNGEVVIHLWKWMHLELQGPSHPGMECQRIYLRRLLPLFVLTLISVQNKIAGQTPPEGFRYASYEVTIPKKLTPRYGQEDSKGLSYLLNIEGKGHMFHLRQKKAFVPKHFPVFTYNKVGELQVDYPFIKEDCFYHGFVQGQLSSQVTLSICSGGLRGVFQLDNMTYEIEPVQASASFQHVVYRLEEKEGAVRMRCGVTKEEERRQELLLQSTEKVVVKRNLQNGWWTHVRYAKLAIVVDHERFVRFDRNETVVTSHVLDIFHTTISFYDPLSIQLYLVGLEIWSERNLITVTSNSGATLWAFSEWRRLSLLPRLRNDAAHLFLYNESFPVLGLAYVETICSERYAAAINYFKYDNIFHFSITFAHELGHNFGMYHDERYCHCDRAACMMAAYHHVTDQFSNCSYRDYFKFRNRQCLLIPPGEMLHDLPYCGNKIVEDGEQCDCGSETECASDPCCQCNCELRSGAACAFGSCCKNCQYAPARSVCRRNISVCDLPEYCHGTSEWCPEDVYVQDGAPCRDGAYCYDGNCTTHDRQCKIIFGSQATVASEDCFRIMNARGDRFGNCGLKHGIYSKCTTPNVLCGRIQCENVDDLPTLEEHSTTIQTQTGDIQCWGLDYHSGVEIPDHGAVRDGTPCGTDMMCIGGECLHVSLLNYDCNITKCHNQGVCNTYKHCHCDYGWAPPDCLKEGYGGSSDSGPPSQDRSAFVAGAVVGTLFALSSATIALAVALYYKVLLSRGFRRLSSVISPVKLIEEVN
ncbi:disintegrin and metalloproteinase domain-containing protein 20-like [Anolis sagrei]|uniref:disintegrin and metalloproteinase domain-containing protein 20-like n=1 Tax=Anolis sagrei TaxID=38937 RepID=UPI00352093BB